MSPNKQSTDESLKGRLASLIVQTGDAIIIERILWRSAKRTDRCIGTDSPVGTLELQREAEQY